MTQHPKSNAEQGLLSEEYSGGEQCEIIGQSPGAMYWEVFWHRLLPCLLCGSIFFAGHRPECGMDGATYGHGNVSTPIFFAGNWRVCDRGLEVVSGSPATG